MPDASFGLFCRVVTMSAGCPTPATPLFGPDEANKEEKGPKRCKTRHLGPRCVFFYFYFSVLLTTDLPHTLTHHSQMLASMGIFLFKGLLARGTCKDPYP